MQNLDQQLQDLRNDRETGAQGLALEALRIAAQWEGRGREWSELTASLESMHPAIAIVGNIARRLAADGPCAIEGLRGTLIHGNRRIAAALRDLIPNGSTLLTLSNSSTVAESLAGLHPREVRIAESLPGGEGRRLAERLEGFPVKVFPDAAMGREVDGADCALVGVDAFDRGGALVHKVGTLPLALVCRLREIPFYAAGHSLKMVEESLAEAPQDEWFDCTPGSLVTAIITEQGVLKFRAARAAGDA